MKGNKNCCYIIEGLGVSIKIIGCVILYNNNNNNIHNVFIIQFERKVSRATLQI